MSDFSVTVPAGNMNTNSDLTMPNMVVAMAYVPMQPWGATYEPEQALKTGTIFPILDKPFLGKEV